MNGPDIQQSLSAGRMIECMSPELVQVLMQPACPRRILANNREVVDPCRQAERQALQ